tara:strand:+ start:242 stop:610 length:369 start_codon:yes stop_codon:yes gene_type:complete
MRIRTDEAIRSLKPNALFSVTETANGERTVNWISKDITQPTDSELDAEVKRLQDLEALKLLREQRNNKLSQSDWRANSDVTMSDDWKTYRQELRDMTKKSNPKLDTYYNLDKSSVTWPTEPS